MNRPAPHFYARPATTGDRRPVLVTGMHRSGTSWLGAMLSAGGDFVNIGEPLNVMNRQTILPRRVTRWYTHISDANEENFLRFFQDSMAFRIHPIYDITKMRFGSPRDPFRVAHRWASFYLGRIQKRRLLIKDPFAVFSIDWFARQLGCHVVVIARHPVAVVSSLKRLSFSFDFENLLQQPTLMQGRLRNFQPQIEAAVAAPDDLVGHGSLLWRIIYETLPFEAAPADVSFVRHEDLSIDPLRYCNGLYDLLGLTLTEHARGVILASANQANPTEVSRRKPFATRLDSRANLSNWQHRLDPADVERILEITEPVSSRYYPEGLAALDSVS